MSEAAIIEKTTTTSAAPVQNSGESTQVTTPTTEGAPSAEDTERAVEHSKIERRIAALTAKRSEAERKAATLEQRVRELEAKELTAKDPEAARVALEEAEIDRRAEIKAAQRLAAEAYQAKVGAFESAGVKEFPDFTDRCNAVAAFLDQKDIPAFMEIVTDIDDGHKAIARLADDPDLADRVLKMSPHKMAIELSKLGALKEEKTRKDISKAPPPLERVTGNARNDGYPANPTVEQHIEWVKKNGGYKR